MEPLPVFGTGPAELRAPTPRPAAYLSAG
jgi:hypothetical protein